MKELKTFLQEDGSYRYSILAPDFVVDREDRPHYEKDRFASMEANLRKGDVLFDVGAELGWQSAVYAKFVGADAMCLFEPHTELWPTIKDTWDLNSYAPPRSSYCGFVSDHTTGNFLSEEQPWPVDIEFSAMSDFTWWKQIHTDPSGYQITLDDFVMVTGIIPRAITIDVEGAELKVLSGAREVLEGERPFVWVSVHPRQRLEAFGAMKQEIFKLMVELGYENQYLGVDHEEHWFFYPASRRSSVVLVPSPWMTNGKRDVTFEQAIPDWTDDMGMPYTSEWAK